jgi:hypothetical protein
MTLWSIEYIGIYKEFYMFAVYRTDTDDCTYSRDVLLFVTESEQTAKDAVALAELEHEDALAIPYPTWTIDDIKKNGAQVCIDRREEYNRKLLSIFTVDIDPERNYVDKNDTYYYEKVEVR